MSDITTDFVSATKKIHAAVRAVLATLHLIREDVKIIREQTVKQTEEQARGQNANNPDAKPEEGISVSSDANKTLTDEKHEDHCSKIKDFFEGLKKNFWKGAKQPKSYIELAALVLLLIYTLETKRSNDLAQSAHRPYLWQVSGIESNKSNIQFLLGGKEGSPQVTVKIQVQNFGQFPAIITRYTGDVVQGGTEGYLNRLSAHDWMPYAGVMPPGRVDTFAVESKETIPKDVTITANPNGTIGSLIRIQYTDTDGHPFESDMCIYTPDGTMKTSDYCPASLHLTKLIDCEKESCEH